MYLDSAFLLPSEEQNALTVIEFAAAHTRNETKEKKRATLFNPREFYFHAAVLLDQLKLIHRKAARPVS